LVLAKAFRALVAHAEVSLNLSRTGVGDSDFRVLEVLLHKGPLPVNTIGPKVWLTPGSISVAVDRLEKTALYRTRVPRPSMNGHSESSPVNRAQQALAQGVE